MPSSLLRAFVRSVTSLVVLAIPLSSCVIKLSDKNAPEVNGGVTGPAANCAAIKDSILPRGAPGGDAAIKYTGRFAFPDNSDPENPSPYTDTTFDWSGSNITVAFEGTDKVTVHLSLQQVPIPQDQLFEFVLDKQTPTTRQITVTKDAKGAPTNLPLTDYVIDHLSPGRHELTLWKNTEAQKGPVLFKGIDVGTGHLVPPTRRPRKMEVIGDSIICGYGIEGTNATCPFEVAIRKAVTEKGDKIDVTIPATENQYLSFTSQAARRLDADISTICWSGKGLYLNYKENYRVDPTGALVADVDAKTTVPDLWKRTIANDGSTPWDFSKEKPEDKPQVVLVSLGTNDFSRDEQPVPSDPSKLPGDNVPDGDLLKADQYQAFKDKYVAFVGEIRAARPDAHIFLATPPMLTDQFPLENARSRLRAALDYVVQQRAAQGDNKVYAMNLVEMGFRYGLGCDYHPNLEVHQIMADQLVGAIQSKTCWN